MTKRQTALVVAAGIPLLVAASAPTPPANDRCNAPAATAASATPGSESSARTAVRSLREDLERGRLAGIAGRIDAARALVREEQEATERARLRLHLGRSALQLADRSPTRASALLAAAGRDFSAAAEDAASEARLRSFALGYLGEVYERAGRREEARQLTRRALFAAQAADAPDAEYRWQWQLGRLERAAGRRPRATRAYREAVETLERLRRETGASARRAKAAVFRSEVEPVYLGLVDLLLRASQETDADEQQALLAEARRTIEALKAAELRDYFRDPCLEAQRKTTLEEVPGAVVLYPILLPDRVELVVGRGDRLERYRAPVDARALAAEVRAFRRTLEKRTTREYLRHAWNLYDWLIRPIDPALRDLRDGIEALIVVPDGVLRTIPLGALQDRESREFLVERLSLAVTPGLTLTEPRSIDKDGVRMLAVGISEPVGGYPALDNVAREIDNVTRHFPGEELVNEEFRVRRFEEEVEGRPFDIVHVASHAEFSADVSKSFLLAYDGRLSMSRLADLVGVTRFRERRPLELLTLSACQTAAGDERAALGLAGVAVQSGARSALATLWSVNDQASTDLLTEFYAELSEPGVSRAEALRRAQLKLLGMHHYRHPYYWSSFLLISSWL